MQVVFDFDGTIADTFEAGLKIVNKLAPEFGYDKLEADDVQRFRRLGSKKALKEFGISWLKFIKIGRRVQKELHGDIKNIRMFDGMADVFHELKSRGISMGILSVNSKENILEFLKINSLEGMFDYIVPCGLFWGKSKRIRKIKKKHKLSDMDLIYVGDETKDIIACHKVKSRIIAVTWGFNSKKALASYHPDWLADEPSEIVSIVDGILT